jgi:hypothetical protein
MNKDFVLNRNVLTEADKRKMSLSAFLETLDPTDRTTGSERNLDAYQRQLMRHDIRVASDPLNGIVADRWERFYDNEESKLLGWEYLKRAHRQRTMTIPRNSLMAGGMTPGGLYDNGGSRAPITAVPTSFTLQPPDVDRSLRFNALQPSMLPFLIGRVRMIQGEAAYGLYLNTDATTEAGTKMGRVTEYAELPHIRVSTSEQAIRVAKYGFAIDISYEKMRRMPIDLVGWLIQYGSDNAERDKEDQAVDVLINGDGNSGTAATNTNGSTLDAAAAGALTLKMDLLWRMKKWRRPYVNDVMVGRAESMVARMLLSAGSANLAAASYLVGSLPTALDMRIARTSLDGITFIDNDTVAANTLLGIDSRYTLEMIVEVGSDIQEADRVITAQYQVITLSENVAFAIIVKGLNQTLAFTA